jgi:hypothetical protein
MNYFDSPDEIRRRQDERLKLEASERQAELETMASNKRKAQAALNEFAEKMTQLREPVTVWKNGRQGKSPRGVDLAIKCSDGSKVDEIAGWHVNATGFSENILFIFVTDRGTACLRRGLGSYTHRQLFQQERQYFIYEARPVDASWWQYDDDLEKLVAVLADRLERRQHWRVFYSEDSLRRYGIDP